jgi:hypothetical protein
MDKLTHILDCEAGCFFVLIFFSLPISVPFLCISCVIVSTICALSIQWFIHTILTISAISSQGSIVMVRITT